MNKEQQEKLDQIHKLVNAANNELVKQAAGIIEMTQKSYKMSPGGLLVPAEQAKGPDYTGGSQKAAKTMFPKSQNTAIQKLKAGLEQHVEKLKELMEKKTGVSGMVQGKHADMTIVDDIADKKYEFKDAKNTIIPKLYPGKVMFVDDFSIGNAPVKFEDGQQVPAHIANDPAIAPKGKPFIIWASELTPAAYDMLGIVAFELAHELYKENPQSASITTESGIEITHTLLEEPSFVYALKIALAKHTDKQVQAEKMAKAAAKAPPAPDGDPLTAQLITALGITAEQYKEWTKEATQEKVMPMAITQSAFNQLLKPGLAKKIKDDFYASYSVTDEMLKDDLEQQEFPPQNQFSDVAWSKEQEKIDKAISYAAKYGLDTLINKSKNSKFVTPAERIAVLESIVAGMLLAPREMKMTDDSFIVSPKTLHEMAKVFHLKVIRKGGDFHVTLE